MADLLVVFDRHVIIFSDRDCGFPNSGNLALDWSRWFRRAVEKSAEQVWGAERWIKSFPDWLYLDRACTQPFPIPLPDPAAAKFHRIVVAHGVSERCREELGGSGSLMIAPDVIGAQHTASLADGGRPFTVGQLDPARGFVHILDDTSLDAVMSTLDTITDFVDYLTKKEQFITSGKLAIAAGEDDLLAYYLRDLNADGKHDFVLPRGADASAALVIDEGFWQIFQASAQRRAQVEANQDSYIWDAIIEDITTYLLNGTYYYSSDPSIQLTESALRLMAREPRLQRRMLGGALLDLMRTTPASMGKNRLLPPAYAGQPHYAYVVYPQAEGQPEDEYRAERHAILETVCLLVKLKFPRAEDIIGIATESGWGPHMRHSWDLMFCNGRLWTDEMQAEAKRIQKETGLLTQTQTFRRSDNEYPALDAFGRRRPVTAEPVRMKGRDRNAPCPCGSGRKFKRCCGR